MKKLHYIDFPQEHLEGHMHRYRCAYCKVETTTINGMLEGHLPSCEYRIKLEKEGYEVGIPIPEGKVVLHGTDEFD